MGTASSHASLVLVCMFVLVVRLFVVRSSADLKLLSAPLARRTQSVSKFVSFVVLAIELQLLTTQPSDTLSKQRQSEQKIFNAQL